MERIPADSWRAYEGHVRRYEYAAARIRPGEVVNDIACGCGYGSVLMTGTYRGFDKPGVTGPQFARPGASFTGCDIDDPAWLPPAADVTTSFETLEHVRDPAATARVLARTTSRAIFVSVPVIPTVHCNEFHRTDFTAADIPPLFPDFQITDDWYQAEETSHVWYFERALAAP